MAVEIDPLAEERQWLDEEAEFSVRVTQMTLESDRVVSLRLASTTGRRLPAWTPGAHIDLNLSSSLVRQYSLCGSPEDLGSYRVAVLREEKSLGGSSYVHDKLRVGQELRVTGPRNHFRLDEAEDYLFIAGGIGITPLLPMIRQAQKTGTPWRLMYAGANRRGMAFLPEVEALQGRTDGDAAGAPAENGAPGEEKVALYPEDEGRRIDLAATVAALGPATRIYACGPAPMLEELEEVCASGEPGLLHIERFMPKRREDTSETDSAIAVECRASGVNLEVPPDQTILEAIEAAGIDWPSSCREGVCGTCEATICEGVADHRDSLLSPDEQEAGETMMVCVSRALTDRLVLDV